MKIVVLSDLNWEPHLRSISEREITDCTVERLRISRYERIKRYYDIATNEGAELVLFAGDLTGDGSCGHGFQNAFKILLKLLHERNITCFFISGNHDEPDLYNDVIDFCQTLGNTKDINNKLVEFNGIKILGIPYSTSASKAKLKTILTENDQEIDIVLAHSQLKRRIRLFKLKTKLIFTGHYDRKILEHRNSVFISLDNDWDEVSYATINYKSGNDISLEYNIRRNKDFTLSLSEHYEEMILQKRNHILKSNGQNAVDLNKLELYKNKGLLNEKGESILYLKYLRGGAYKRLLHILTKLNKSNIDIDSAKIRSQLVGIQITATYKVSKSLIKDYLGKITSK